MTTEEIETILSQNQALQLRIFDLRKALNDITGHYVKLANSGDCGNWDPESEQAVIGARVALLPREGEAHQTDCVKREVAERLYAVLEFIQQFTYPPEKNINLNWSQMRKEVQEALTLYESTRPTPPAAQSPAKSEK